MLNLPKNFFIQPAQGWTDDTRGRTPKEIEAYEQKIGFTLPQLFKDLYAIQNGGSIFYEKINEQEEFSMYGGFSQIFADREYPLADIREIILCTNEETDIDDIKKDWGHFYPERLIIFGSGDGHSYWCLDYGYKQEEARTEPHVIYITEDGDDFLFFGEAGPSFESFAEFLQTLSPGGQWADDAVFIGITTDVTYDEVVLLLQSFFNTVFTVNTDDRNGWFTFPLWHSGFVKFYIDEGSIKKHRVEEVAKLDGPDSEIDFAELYKTVDEIKALLHPDEAPRVSTHVVLSPNKQQSGTYRFQDNSNITLVLEIRRDWFTSTTWTEELIQKLSIIPEFKKIETLL